MKRKKSQANIEIVISFILFIGSLIFILYFLNPLSKKEEKYYYIDEIKTKIIKNLSTNIGKLSIITIDGNCYNFQERDYLNENYFETYSIQNPKVYTIYFSEIFNSNFAPHKRADCPRRNYTLSSYIEENIISYKKILNFKNNYENNYESLKKFLGVNRDFSFSFRYLNKTEIPELSVYKKIPTTASIKIEEIPLIVMDENAKIHQLIFVIKVW